MQWMNLLENWQNPFWGPFYSKTQRKIFQKKKKKIMRHWFLTIYTWKTSLWAPSGTLLAQKPQNKILPKNLYQVNCNPIWKKKKKKNKLGAPIFLKTWKTFWAYFCSFVLPILAPLTLYFCNLMQKIKKIQWIIWAPKSVQE